MIVELPNVVPTAVAKGIIAEGKVIVPDGTGAELAATVLMEEGAEVIHVDIGSELGHDHEIDERRDVDDRWDTCCDVGIIAVSYRLKVEEHAMDIVVLCVGDVFVFGVMVDKLRIYRTPPTEKISLHAPSQGVVIGTVGLHDVATGHFGRLVTGLVHLLNVDTVFVHLDFLHEDIEATIIAVENHLAILASRGILADLIRQLVGQHIAHPGLVVRQRVENPVVFGRHPKEADIVVGDIVVLECRQAVRLLVRNHLRGVATPLNANTPVIVEVFGVVDVSQKVARAILMPNDLHRGQDFWFLRNAGTPIRLNDHDRQVAVGEGLSSDRHRQKNKYYGYKAILHDSFKLVFVVLTLTLTKTLTNHQSEIGHGHGQWSWSLSFVLEV